MKFGRVMVLTLAISLFSFGLAVSAAAAGSPDDCVYMQVIPSTNYAGGADGSNIAYVTSNDVPRTVFPADMGRAARKPPVAVYLNNSEVFKKFEGGPMN